MPTSEGFWHNAICIYEVMNISIWQNLKIVENDKHSNIQKILLYTRICQYRILLDRIWHTFVVPRVSQNFQSKVPVRVSPGSQTVVILFQATWPFTIIQFTKTNKKFEEFFFYQSLGFESRLYWTDIFSQRIIVLWEKAEFSWPFIFKF